MSIPAVFLDKDGTLVENVPYNTDVSRIRFAPGVFPCLHRLAQAGFIFIVVTNQSGIGRGIIKEADVQAVGAHLAQAFRRHGLPLKGFYYCPHHPQALLKPYRCSCSCRKPAPGMLITAANDLDLDLRCSWMIGDILDDVECAHRAGCRAVLLDNGNETIWQQGLGRTPDAIAQNWKSAVDFILKAMAQAKI